MSEKIRTYRLFITPQTWVGDRQTYKWAWTYALEDLKEAYPEAYKYRMRREKYKNYKISLREEAERVGFVIPDHGIWIKFYIPMPKTWSNKKKLRMDFQPHQSKPDASNLHKAFEDALKQQDMTIWDYRVSKFWYSSIKGYIEVLVPETSLGVSKVVVAAQDAVIK